MTRKQKRRRAHKKQVQKHRKSARTMQTEQQEPKREELSSETKVLPVIEPSSDPPKEEDMSRKRRRKKRKKPSFRLDILGWVFALLALLLDWSDRKWKAWRRERTWKKRIPGLWEQPFTLWSDGNCVRVWIGKRVIHLAGKQKGRIFYVPVKNLYHWGIGSGPWLSADKQVELIHLIQAKTRPNPFLRVMFRG